MMTMMVRGDDVSGTASPWLIACLAREQPACVRGDVRAQVRAYVRILGARLRTYVRAHVSLFVCLPTYVSAGWAATVHYVPKSAPAPRNPDSAATGHCVTAKELHFRTPRRTLAHSLVLMAADVVGPCGADT